MRLLRLLVNQAGGADTYGRSSLSGSTSAKCGYTVDTLSQKDESQGSMTASDLVEHDSLSEQQTEEQVHSLIFSPSILAQCQKKKKKQNLDNVGVQH